MLQTPGTGNLYQNPYQFYDVLLLINCRSLNLKNRIIIFLFENDSDCLLKLGELYYFDVGIPDLKFIVKDD